MEQSPNLKLKNSSFDKINYFSAQMIQDRIKFVTKQSDEVRKYFETLHCNDQKGGSFVYACQDNIKETYDAYFGWCIEDIIYKFNVKKNCSVFCTLNSYKQKTKRNLRHESNLWGFDCIMIDIDAPKSFVGKEPLFIKSISKYWNDFNILLKPNMYSFTGGGGVHLYYTFDRLPASAKGSVVTARKILNKIISKIIETDEDIATLCKGGSKGYHIDFKVLDNQRYDRVAGSINPKTGEMCTCYPTGIDPYTIQEIFNSFDGNKYIISEYKKKKRIVFPQKNKKIELDDKLLTRIMNGRVKGLLRLLETKRCFEGQREVFLYILGNSLKATKMNKAEIYNFLLDCNNKFDNQISKCEIRNIVKSDKVYKFTNKKICQLLDLTPTEIGLVFPSKRPGDRKERTRNNMINIAKEVVSGLSISQISNKLKISQSIVKHMRVKIKANGGFLLWACENNLKTYKKALKELVQKLKEDTQNYFGFYCTAIGSFCHISNILPRGDRKRKITITDYDTLFHTFKNITVPTLSKYLQMHQGGFSTHSILSLLAG